MMKKKIGISVPRAKSYSVAQKGYDNAAGDSIVNTGVIQDIAEAVLQRDCVSSVREEIASTC